MLDKNTVRHERTRPEFLSGAPAGAETWLATLAEYQHEVGQFISDRLAKEAEVIRETLSCRDWTSALVVQGRWVDETLRDYSEGMKRLAGLYSKSAASTTREERRRA